VHKLYAIRVVSLLLVIFFAIPTKQVDSELEPYYTEVMNVIKEECPSLKVPRRIKVLLTNEDLSPFGNPFTVGICYFMGGQFKVLIKESYFYNSIEQEKFALVAHELTHCVLGYMHSDDPSDFMYPYIDYIPKQRVIEQLKEKTRKRCNN
jgi:hypothetical protein